MNRALEESLLDHHNVRPHHALGLLTPAEFTDKLSGCLNEKIPQYPEPIHLTNAKSLFHYAEQVNLEGSQESKDAIDTQSPK